MADKLTKREVLELVRDCSSQEWQQPDGKRMAATDNQGRRMWFITEDIMQAVRASIGDTPAPQSKDGGEGNPADLIAAADSYADLWPDGEAIPANEVRAAITNAYYRGYQHGARAERAYGRKGLDDAQR